MVLVSQKHQPIQVASTMFYHSRCGRHRSYYSDGVRSIVLCQTFYDNLCTGYLIIHVYNNMMAPNPREMMALVLSLLVISFLLAQLIFPSLLQSSCNEIHRQGLKDKSFTMRTVKTICSRKRNPFVTAVEMAMKNSTTKSPPFFCRSLYLMFLTPLCTIVQAIDLAKSRRV